MRLAECQRLRATSVKLTVPALANAFKAARDGHTVQALVTVPASYRTYARQVKLPAISDLPPCVVLFFVSA
jgi:hypothetical protein